MKIDRSKLKKSSSEVPADCIALIERLKSCSEDELLAELKKIETWTYGKCELYHWVDVLDLFDSILERAYHKEHENSWVLACDLPQNKQLKELLLWTLHFTTLLIEHSFSRHLYNSMEHLTSMLSSNCLNVVLGVLNLLYMFSKRTDFISRLASEQWVSLLPRLTYLAESWGGKENGFGLAECCKVLPLSSYPSSATTLHFEFYAELMGDGTGRQSGSGKSSGSFVTVIHVEHVEWLNKSPAQLMEELIDLHHVPLDKQMQLFTHIRLTRAFSDYRRRLQCVQARLQALSVLIYCNALADAAPSLLYAGLLEELVDVLELTEPQLMEIRAAALRTLTAIIHLDRNPNFPKINTIIDVTGAAMYHGFLPVLVRSCIASLTGQHTEQDMIPFPLPLATALFSFLYHLASYEAGGEALVACGMMESLLRVVSWPGSELEHITFVTRAVRVIDLITNLDMHAFQEHCGLQIFIYRLESEVDACREEQPYEICPPVSVSAAKNAGVNIPGDGVVSSSSPAVQPLTEPIPGVTCLPQRGALLESILNFLKKAIQDSSCSDSIRHVMDGSLPAALKHIISNAEYYGPSLFLLATDVVTAYVFQKPSLLSSLQDSGLTYVVLHALLVKDMPATREVLGSLSDVISALCLNARGLASFVACKPFQRLFKVLLSPDYLSAMRRSRSSGPMGDTATKLGNALDQLIRHQPSLRTDATAGIIQLLEELCALGHDPNYIASSRTRKFEVAQNTSARTGPVEATGGGSSDEEEDEEEEATSSSNPAPIRGIETEAVAVVPSKKTPVPLVDYVLNVMKFVDAILSNNSTDDHCREFVSQRGLIPLLGILGLPNLPVDFPVTPACQAVAAVCKSILNLAHEPLVLKQGLDHLQVVLNTLQQLHKPLDPPGGSVLLRELASSSNPAEAITSPNTTPLLHAMAAAHAYIMMFVHVCRTGQSDSTSLNHWGSPLGLPVLKGLSKLYTSLVWEITVLLALCSDETLPLGCQFGQADLEKLLPPELKTVAEGPSCSGAVGMELGTNSVAAALQALSTEASPPAAMEVDHDQLDAKDRPCSEKLTPAQQHQMKIVNPLLSTASRLRRSLNEHFRLLVKLCVGSPTQHAHAHQAPPTPLIPSPSAQAVAGALTQLLTSGLAWEPPVTSPTPKFRLTFLICSVGFTSLMLFDEKKLPYHLMLHKFVSCGGQAAFFDAFYWALSAGGRVAPDQGLEYPDLPEGTGEFLDAWLMLLEKMVNPKNILDSPHQLPNKALHGSKLPFSPLKYLISTHRQAFDAVMKLWGKRPLKVYGARMTESVLTILCHILKGEVIIQEKLALENVEEPAVIPPAAISGSSANVTPGILAVSSTVAAPGEPASGSSAASRCPAPKRGGAESDADLVNSQHLQALMDMGFPRDQCVEALLFTTSLEQATDYVLSTPPSLLRAPHGVAAAASAATVSTAMDTDGNDEDAVMRAIALSLTADSDRADDAGVVEKEPQEYVLQGEPLSKQVLDQFVQQALGACLSLLDSLPETVYRICSLVVAMVHRNGEMYRDSMLASLEKEIGNCVTSVQDHLDGTDSLGSKVDALKARLNLFTLFCEEMKIASALQMEEREEERRVAEDHYQGGGDVLIACGMMKSLLRVVSWPGLEIEHITFVTCAVRVIDLITNLEMHAFQEHCGLQIFIYRLESEVDTCREEQPYEICPPVSAAAAKNAGVNIPGDGVVSSSSPAVQPLTEPIPGVTCLPQRGALLESILNFLKKAIQDSSCSGSIRRVMDGSLPAALKHIISNAEYYGPSLFLLAIDVVTAYVFQKPSLLSSLQDSGLTYVVLHALLVKDMPATREVLGSLPDVISALCLNARGLASFVACKPFQRLFKVLLSPDYWPAVHRSRISDPRGDTGIIILADTMDNLIRRQPSLQMEATAGIAQLLKGRFSLVRDYNEIAMSQNKMFEDPPKTSLSDSSDEEEEEATSSSNPAPIRGIETEAGAVVPSEMSPVPLVDYVLNVMKFVDAILGNNPSDDHCREFISQQGLIPLMSSLRLKKNILEGVKKYRNEQWIKKNLRVKSFLKPLSVNGQRHECEVVSITKGPYEFFVKILDGNEELRPPHCVSLFDVEKLTIKNLNEKFRSVSEGSLIMEVVDASRVIKKIKLWDEEGKSILNVLASVPSP